VNQFDLNENDDLFTDYAMQLFMAFMREGKPLVEEYMKTLEQEFLTNESFTPGLVFGMLMHMMLLIKVISTINDTEIEETLSLYALEYNDNRKHFAGFPTNHPKFAKELMKQIENQIKKNK